jgi:hypothetical protein
MVVCDITKNSPCGDLDIIVNFELGPVLTRQERCAICSDVRTGLYSVWWFGGHWSFYVEIKCANLVAGVSKQVRSLGIDVVVVFTTFSVFSFSLKLFLPLVTDPEQERTSRECAAYISASRLQFKHYSPFKLIVQIIQELIPGLLKSLKIRAQELVTMAHRNI